MAKKICISWESSRKYFRADKVILTGNPIRKFPLMKSEFRLFNNKLPTIYVTGGSSGSHAINILIEGIIGELLKKYNVIHQTGDAQEYNDFDRLEKNKQSLPEELRENYILQKLIDPSEVGDIISISSLIVSRSGMNIVTELIHFEKPALLIPLPFPRNGEQTENAKFLERIGLAFVMDQAQTNEKKLLKTIERMFAELDKFKIKELECRHLPGKNAAQNIISVINYVIKSKTQKAL